MKKIVLILCVLVLTLTACGTVDLNAPLPDYQSGIDPNTWAKVPAGPFFSGQHSDKAETGAYEIMVTPVTVAQYADFLNKAVAAGDVKVDGNTVKVFYPGDEFNAYKHEERIDAAEYAMLPLDDPSTRVKYDGTTFTAQPGYENHPMTMVSWFGAWGYCKLTDARLPTDHEWEKAARGEDERPFPWGDEVLEENANYSASRDPFEDMGSFGSRTTPVGFYNGQKYGDFQTIDSKSPYGVYDMAGNVWQWTRSVYKGMHYRMLRGGSKDTYAVDLRIWVTNNATPSYVSPGAGFRCARN